MKAWYLLSSLAFLCVKSGEAYTKYGRSCSDIGCASNEECIMAETPCSYYSRENECGMYPTCRKTSNAAPTCATYICPPTKKCFLDGDTPKCVDDDAANVPGNQNGNKAYQTYNTHNTNDQPSAPNPQPAYPILPGQTTTRAPIRRPQASGGGYQGGSVGSGYPGQAAGGYQGGSVGSGYPGQSGGGYQGGSVGSGYPGQAGGGYQGGASGSRYPAQGGYQGGSVGSAYPGQGAGGYQGRYPQQGYAQGGYQQPGYGQPGYGYQPGQHQQGYGSQGGYNNHNQRQPQQTGGSNPIYDTLKNTLQTYGTNLLKNALGNFKF